MQLVNYYESAFFKERHIYIHNDPAKRSVTVLWHGITPTGRVSKYTNYYQAIAMNPTDTSDGLITKALKRASLPKLPKGYVWSEPLLYADNAKLHSNKCSCRGCSEGYYYPGHPKKIKQHLHIHA